jgi:bacteriorhodopsin
MVVAGLVCAIACFPYYKMTAVYQSGLGFPTALRYVDWLFTTPLLLVKFPLLLRLGERGAKFFWQLVALDVAMIVGVLFVSLGQAITDAPAPLAKALQTIRLFVLIDWAIYPVGFLMARAGAGEYREVIYNVADVINKVGFGLVAYHGIKDMDYGTERRAAS